MKVLRRFFLVVRVVGKRFRGAGARHRDAFEQPAACKAHRGVVGILSMYNGAEWCSDMFELQSMVYYNATPRGPRVPYDCVYPVAPFKGDVMSRDIHTNYGILTMEKGDYRIEQAVFNYNFMVIGSGVMVGVGLLILFLLCAYCGLSS